jgi:hypothetical protein
MSLVFCILHQNGSSEPILRVSSDAEQPYGPMLRLATNSTTSSTEDEATTTALRLEKKDKQISNRIHF